MPVGTDLNKNITLVCQYVYSEERRTSVLNVMELNADGSMTAHTIYGSEARDLVNYILND